MKLKLIAMAAVLTLVSGLALAEHDCGKGKFDKSNWQQQRAERFEQHQARLHTQLQLSAAQESAWQTLQGQLRNDTNHGWAEHEALDKLTTLERLDKMEALDKVRDTQRAQRAAAIRTFYAQLSEPQKKVFDENAFPKHPHFKSAHFQ